MVAKHVMFLLAHRRTAEEVIDIMASSIDANRDLPPMQVAMGSALDISGPVLPRINSGNTHNVNVEISPYGNQYVPVSLHMRAKPLEPRTPATVYTPGLLAPALGLLPTPRLTPQTSGFSTPAVTAV